MSSRRQKRIADLIARELSDIIHRRVKDPRVTDVTITGVRVSPDYQCADINFYRLGGDPEKLEDAMKGLKSALGFIRRELGSRLTIRHTPELRFHLDESIDYGDRIDSLLSQIEQERQTRDEEGRENSTVDN